MITKIYIKKYLPDILIQVGVFSFFYAYFFHPSIVVRKALMPVVNFGSERIVLTGGFKSAGIMIISIGVNIAIRRIIKNVDFK